MLLNVGRLAVKFLPFRIVEPIGRVVRREHAEGAIDDAAPHEFLVGGVARRRAAHVFRALEAGPVHVVGGQEQVLRTGLAVNTADPR